MKLAILDRIGTVQTDGEDSIVALQNWQPQPGVLEAIAQLNRHGWHVTLASNQPALGRGSMEFSTLNALHTRMQRELAAAGGRVEAAFFCPHTPEDHCQCRKPEPGLLNQIAARYGAEPHEIWVIGQDVAHLEAGDAVDAHLAWVAQDGNSLPASWQHVPQYPTWSALAQALAPDAQTPPPAPVQGAAG